jgi:hypothetical protein
MSNKDLQLTLDFEPSLVERHKTAVDCVRQCVYTHRNPIKTIAADMDLSESELSRKLAQNPNDTRRFTLDDLESYVQTTGDSTPIMYLAAKYLADQNMLKQAAVNRLLREFPEFMALMKTVLNETGTQP